MLADANGLPGESGQAYAVGYDLGYACGVSRNPCTSEADLVARACALGFSGKEKEFVLGFQQGYTDGSSCSAGAGITALSSDGAMNRGLKKTDKHRMDGTSNRAYAHGYKEGYSFSLGQSQAVANNGKGVCKPCYMKTVTKDDILQSGRQNGYASKHLDAYYAGYLAGMADGGAVVRHVITCDVHRCTSASCTVSSG